MSPTCKQEAFWWERTASSPPGGWGDPLQAWEGLRDHLFARMDRAPFLRRWAEIDEETIRRWAVSTGINLHPDRRTA